MDLSDKYFEILERVFENRLLKKAVFSKSKDKTVLKSELKPFIKGNERFYQLESFLSDNKAVHKNMDMEEALSFCESARSSFGQINLITTGGNCEILVSKSGSLHISGEITIAKESEGESHDKKKNYILDPKEHSGFLSPLGVCDEKGNIFEKKRSKFRQIERFIEIIDDLYPEFPESTELCVCDLCCGKSYLTFAAYYYLTEIRKRKVKMFGVDLKKDVIEFCRELAGKIGAEGLEFVCGDVSTFDPGMKVDAVISLHACDIATDFVLSFAIKHDVNLVFSTPCCHHEMMHTIDCEALDFITEYPLLKQKLCDAATDSLRALMLKANSYRVEVIELIDPEETPKNVMLRAHKAKIPSSKKKEYLEKYESVCRFLNVEPMLSKLLK